MKLYHSSRSRSVRPLWLLEEIGAPYELVQFDMSKSEHKTPDYLKIHPHGQVPALTDGDLALIESAAICSYLADKFPDKQLAPPVGTPARGKYYQWMHYSVATLEPPVLQIFLNTIQYPEDKRSPAVVEEARANFVTVAKVLAEPLKSKPFLLGDQFSAADVMVGATLAWAQFMGMLTDHPTLQAYVKRLAERPAFQRAHSL